MRFLLVIRQLVFLTDITFQIDWAFNIKKSINLFFSFFVLRCPCAVDRAFNFNYYFFFIYFCACVRVRVCVCVRVRACVFVLSGSFVRQKLLTRPNRFKFLNPTTDRETRPCSSSARLLLSISRLSEARIDWWSVHPRDRTILPLLISFSPTHCLLCGSVPARASRRPEAIN